MELIFKKWDHFENWQKWPQCKGYSLCKMVSLGKKLKMPKTCDKRLYKHIRLLLRKKRLQKAANIWEMGPFRKLAKMATMQGLYPLLNGQFGSKIKIAESMRKTAVDAHYSCIMQKTAPKKQLTFEKWDHFEIWQKWPQCKGYSLCKVVILGQKLKFREKCEKELWRHITVVSWKKNTAKNS